MRGVLSTLLPKSSSRFGHGYFVKSSTGSVNVWGRTANYTAHNAFFQVFITTGVVGLALFIWALWRPGWLALRCLRGGGDVRMTAIFSLLIAVWILGWGMQDAGIVLQTVPPTVVFFAVLGLAAGQLSPAA